MNDTVIACPIRRRLNAWRNGDWSGASAGLDKWLAIQRDPLAWLASVHQAQPDISSMRMGPRRVWCVFHPEAVHALMVTHRNDLRRWEPSLCMMRQWNGRSFMMREGAQAREQRQKVRPHIQPPPVADILRLAQRWSDGIPSGARRDLDLEMACYSITLTGHALFGLDLSESAESIARAVRILSRVALLETSTGLPLGHWFPSKLCPRKRWALRTLRTQIENVAARSTRPLTVHREDLATLLMAAHQSTGATLAWTQLLLAQHPGIRDALRTQLDAIDWRDITRLQDLQRVPLLRAVIQESMRLYPPAYALVPRQLSRALQVHGHTLHRGDIVMVSSWITQRDARWFPEPTRFMPERFLGEHDRPQGAYFPFGLGDRACPGTGMAMLDLAVSLAYWITHWDIELLQPVQPQGWFSLRPRQAEVRFVPRPGASLRGMPERAPMTAAA